MAPSSTTLNCYRKTSLCRPINERFQTVFKSGGFFVTVSPKPRRISVVAKIRRERVL